MTTGLPGQTLGGLPRERPSANLGSCAIDITPRIRHPVPTSRILAAVLVAALVLPGPARAHDTELLTLSLEELGQIRITSVSRRQERLATAASAIHVITREQIRRSGVTSIPEALRMAPGLEVARNGTGSWTISTRGFSSDLSNKLLVLIDGRSVYSPLFAGVFWDAQDTLIGDIERIEVISGPGGTLWGSNAVNGVVNIITRSAWDTRGGVVSVRGGNRQTEASIRIGGRMHEDLAARWYAKGFERDVTRSPTGADDDWRRQQTGFRLDWRPGDRDNVTIQGDVYKGDTEARILPEFTLGTLPGERVEGTVESRGHNLNAHWQRSLERAGTLGVRLIYDHTYRDIPGNYRERRDTFDAELIHAPGRIGRHEITWGASYRTTRDDIDGTQFSTFMPARRRDETLGGFLQDRINLYDERVFLTLGTKLERNDYSGTEHQPNVRFAWHATANQTLWAAVSRAVRIPARLNEDLELFAPIGLAAPDLPFYVNVQSSDDFRPEELLAREIGYRFQWSPELSADLVLFEHRYDHLQTNEVIGAPFVVPGPPSYLVLPIRQGNGMRGNTWGGTLDLNWQAHPSWRLQLQLARTRFDLELRENAVDQNALNVAGNTPEYQAALYSWLDLPFDLSLYAGLRYVDDLPNQGVGDYLVADLHLGWQPTGNLRAAVTVRNLNDRRHFEFGSSQAIQRGVAVSLDWSF